MKNVKRLGFVVFIAGIVFFTLNIFIGSYKFDTDKVHAYFDHSPNNFDKGDTIARGFIEQVNYYAATNSNPIDNIASFNRALPKIIDAYNQAISESLLETQGITQVELSQLITKATETGEVVYNEALINELFPENKNKIQLLKDNTSWMFQDQRTYEDKSEFENNLRTKIDEFNKSIGYQYHISKEGWSLIDLNKAFIDSGAKNNPGLWFFLTFGLIIIGSVVYNLTNLKLLGPPGIKNDGIYHENATNRGWVAWIVLLYLVGFYVVLYFFPQYIANAVILVDPVSEFLSGNPASQWFLYGFIYSVAMSIMAIRMYIKYRHNRYQIFRTTVVLFFQLAFAFIIPELLVRFNMPYYDFKNAWPLDYDFFFDFNIDNLIAGGNLGLFMLVWGIVLTAVIVPIMVYFFGKRWYCSWVCGCGGLAETVGDPYRQLSNKKMWAWKLERWLIHGVLVFAIIMTGITLYTLFTGANDLFGIETYSIQKSYGFLIGSIFSGVIGTGFYPIFGNRTWCRFGCPLAAYLGLVQRFKSRFRITTNGGQCISCGNCSTYCEQGIDVRAYAQKGQNIVRSSCVGCGVCAAVCPRGVLKLENGPEAGRFGNEGPIVLGNEGFHINA
ncbi:4Fe-4S binding protein [Crocinitomix sp.]|nr:4Fe-4S binding protein [Crocinitomix sp.]